MTLRSLQLLAIRWRRIVITIADMLYGVCWRGLSVIMLFYMARAVMLFIDKIAEAQRGGG